MKAGGIYSGGDPAPTITGNGGTTLYYDPASGGYGLTAPSATPAATPVAASAPVTPVDGQWYNNGGQFMQFHSADGGTWTVAPVTGTQNPNVISGSAIGGPNGAQWGQVPMAQGADGNTIAKNFWDAQIGYTQALTDKLNMPFYLDPQFYGSLFNMASAITKDIANIEISGRLAERDEEVVRLNTARDGKIADVSNEMHERTTIAQQEADERMNGVGGMNDRLDERKQQTIKDIEVLRLEHLERMAALADANNRFSGRGDYSYGSPELFA